MTLDGALGEDELSCDSAVGAAFSHEGQDVSVVRAPFSSARRPSARGANGQREDPLDPGEMFAELEQRGREFTSRS